MLGWKACEEMEGGSDEKLEEVRKEATKHSLLKINQ
jgi:hypothetical protein